MNGIDSHMKSSSLQSVIEQQVNIIDQNGGVIPPIMILTIAIRPKCIGSTPNLVTTGTKRGAIIINAAPPSNNIPKSNNSALIKSNIFLHQLSMLYKYHFNDKYTND